YPNDHVEDPIHLAGIDVSVLLENLEDARDTPAFRFDDRIAIGRENPRQIADETAAGDVGEAFDHAARNLCQERLIIFVHAQQFLTNADRRSWQPRSNLQPNFCKKDYLSK